MQDTPLGALRLLGGIVLGLALLGVLGVIYRYLFLQTVATIRVLELLQERLRYVAVLPVLLVPLWIVVQSNPRLSDIYDEVDYAFYLGMLIVGIEATLAVVTGYLLARVGVRVPQVLETALRTVIYVAVTLYFLNEVLGLHLLDSDTFYGSLWILLVYFTLHLIYRFLFRVVQWKNPLARSLRDRLRFWAYLLVLLLTFAYAVNSFPLIRGNYVDMVNQALLALVAILVLETLLVLVFEFYFPTVRRTTVPSLFRDLTRGIIYLAMVLFALGFIYKQDLSTLLLGSTVVSVILGLALQETLGNFFAGLALGVSKPYNLGDFVEVTGVTGMVERIDWRMTVLRTTTGDNFMFPNSLMAKERIQNFSLPSTLEARLIDVGAHYRHPPNEVKRAMLEAAYSCADVETDPAPEVWLMSFGDSSINYRLRFWMRASYARRWEIDSKVREAIWYHFSRHHIEIPFPMRNVIHHRPESSRDIAGEVRALLDQVDFLKALDAPEFQTVVDRTKLQLFAHGEKVFSQGDSGDAFYIIKSGRLRVSARNAQGEVFLAKDLHAGEFFGEMALLTGEPRSASVEAVLDSELLKVDKEALRAVLRTNPNVDRLISEVLARRQMSTVKARQELEAEKARNSAEQQALGAGQMFEQLSEQFLKRIRDFFSY